MQLANDANATFQNSLSIALEQLQLTIMSEFENALREASGVQMAQSNADNVVQSPIPNAHNPPLAKSNVLNAVQCSILPSNIHDDEEGEAMLGIREVSASEGWPPEVRAPRTIIQRKSMVGSMTNSSYIIDVAEVGVGLHRTYSRDRASPQSSGLPKVPQQDSSGNADMNVPNTTSSHECDQPFLRISPFWMRLVAEGLHKPHLGTIGDEVGVAESVPKDLFRAATARDLRGGTLGSHSLAAIYPLHMSNLWLMRKLRMDDEHSLCFKLLKPLILLPDARFRILWSFLSLLILAYDGVMIPIDACFRSDREDSSSLLILQLPMQVFWSADIPVSFLSAYLRDGVLETSPGVVAENYMKTWFAFDMCLVSVEWYFFYAEGLASRSIVSLLRNLRAFRMFRIIRFLRVTRLWKSMPFIRKYLLLSSQGISAGVMLFGVVFVCFLYAHIGACLWHLIGENLDAGWISTNGMQNYSISRRYVICLHYMFIRLQGSSSNVITVHDPFEILVDTSIIFLSLLLASVLMSIFSQALVAWIRSDVRQVKKLAVEFLNRHSIHPETKQRVYNYLQANQMRGPGEVITREGKLLRALPANLQEELLFESRQAVMCGSPLFSLIVAFSSRCLRAVCQKATSDLLAVEGEVVFHKGDENLGETYFLRSGALLYKCDEDILRETPRIARTLKVMQGCETVKRGSIISEAALFVHGWRHVGDLVPERDSILLVINVNQFTRIIESYRLATICALKYARHFVWSLNRSVQCDLSGFDFNIQMLDEDLVTGTAEDHFAFISHYKVEAGTEATLLRDLMEQKIREDPSNESADFLSPVFVDSEDLVDLARLEQHVLGSVNLVVLLTPGILTRPWCLLEIVVAIQNDVQLVPVEVQRPGMRYEYPNAEWYSQFCDGKILQRADEELLRKNGHSLEAVGKAVRQMFKKISLPFSPHKSGNVRNAEIEDLMKRCHASGGDTSRPSWGLVSSQKRSAKLNLTDRMRNGGLATASSARNGGLTEQFELGVA